MRAILAFAVMCVCWGSNFAVLKETLSEVPPFLLAAVRFLLAGGLLLLWVMARSPTPSIQWADLSRLLLPSLLTITLNYAAIFWSSPRLPSGILGVVNPGSVVLAVMGFSLLYRQEAWSWLKLLGIAVGIGGLSLLGLSGNKDNSLAGSAVPIMFTVLGALAYGWGAVMLRTLTQQYHPLEVTTWQMLLGGVLLLGLSLAFEPLVNYPLAIWLQPAVVAGLLYQVLLSSILAFALNNYLLSVWPATRVASYGFIIPVIALGLGVGLLGEQIGGFEFAACGLLLLSTAVVQWANRP